MAVWTGDTLTPSSTVINIQKAPISSARVKDIANADYTITDGDGYDFVTSVTTLTANRTVTLPAASTNVGRVITIKKIDSGAFTIIIDTPGSETIDGAAQNRLNVQYSWITIMCVSTTLWTVIDCNDYVQNTATTATSTPAVSSGTDTNITSVSVPEGEWELDGQGMVGNSFNTVTAFAIGLNTVSATQPASSPFLGDSKLNCQSTANNIGAAFGILAPYRVKLTTATTYYLIGTITCTNVNGAWFGRLSCRRVG